MCVAPHLTAEPGGLYAAAMTTTTAAATAPPAEPDLTPHQIARLAGVALLNGYLAALAELGYRKRAIDTYVSRDGGHYVRHSYCNGEWSLFCGHRGEGALEVRYSIRATIPSVEQLLNATLPPPF